MDSEEKDFPFGFHAHLDLQEAIHHGQDNHLCTAGELSLLESYLSLPLEAQQLYSGLLKWTSELTLEETLRKHPQISAKALDLLLDTHFIIALKGIHRSISFSLYSLDKINKLCKIYGIKVRGTKTQRIDTILSSTSALPEVVVFKIMYKDLFARIFRGLFLQHTTEWSQPTVQRIQNQVFYPYRCSPRPLHSSRHLYREYRLYYQLFLSGKSPSVLRAPDWYDQSVYKFSALRFYRKLIYSLAIRSEKTNPALSHQLYSSLMPHEKAHIRMLILFRNHPNPQALYRYTKKEIQSSSLEHALSLYQSLHGLSTFHKLRKGIAPQILEPNTRVFFAKPIAKGPVFLHDIHTVSVEEYVMRILNDHQCRVIFSENSLWRYLLTIVFFPTYFEHSQHQFPSPYQKRPLEQNSSCFYEMNKKSFEDTLNQIEEGEIVRIYRENLKRIDHPAFLHFTNSFSKSIIEQILTVFPRRSLANILRHLIQNPKSSGMPDICVLSPQKIVLRDFIPGEIPKGLFFVEIKSKRDTIRNNQKAMIDLLLRNDIHVELWKQHSLDTP